MLWFTSMRKYFLSPIIACSYRCGGVFWVEPKSLMSTLHAAGTVAVGELRYNWLSDGQWCPVNAQNPGNGLFKHAVNQAWRLVTWQESVPNLEGGWGANKSWESSARIQRYQAMKKTSTTEAWTQDAKHDPTRQRGQTALPQTVGHPIRNEMQR